MSLADWLRTAWANTKLCGSHDCCLNDAVMTVLDDSPRQAPKALGCISGLNVVRFIIGTTAAAIAHEL